MMTKFAAKFNEFSQLEYIKNLNDDAKVALFGIYCQAISQSKPQPKAPEPKTNTASSSKPATFKQAGLLQRLIKYGQLPQNTNIDGLSSRDASQLIDTGIKTRKGTHLVEAEEEPDEANEEGEFRGSYNHQTGDLSSHALFD